MGSIRRGIGASLFLRRFKAKTILDKIDEL